MREKKGIDNIFLVVYTLNDINYIFVVKGCYKFPVDDFHSSSVQFGLVKVLAKSKVWNWLKVEEAKYIRIELTIKLR